MKKLIRVVLTIFFTFLFIGTNAAFVAEKTERKDQKLKSFSFFDRSKNYKSQDIKKIFKNIDKDQDLKIISFKTDKTSYLLGQDESLHFEAEVSSNDSKIEIFADDKSLGFMEDLEEVENNKYLYTFTLDDENLREILGKKDQDIKKQKAKFYIKIDDKLSDKIEVVFKDYKNLRSSIEGRIESDIGSIDKVAVKLDYLKKGFEQEAVVSLRSDSEGRYKIEDLPLGEYSITFAKDGYKMQTIQFYLGEDKKIINPQLEKDQESKIYREDRPRKYYDQASALKLSNLINEYRKDRGLFEKKFLVDDFYQKKADIRAKKLKGSFYYGEGLDSLINKVRLPGLAQDGKSLEEKALDNRTNKKRYYKDIGELLNEDPNKAMLIGIYVEDDLAYISYYSGGLDTINAYVSKEDVDSLDNDIMIIK